jgi:hypothetical protein
MALQPEEGEAMSRAERALKLILRAGGSACLLAVVAVVMPRRWMAVTHEWLGVGTFPDGPIVEYLARSLSAFYAMLGGALWVAASDVRRFAPLLVYKGVTGLAFGVVLLIVDISVGLPWHWTLQEGPFVLVFSMAILLLLRRVVAEGHAGAGG